MAVLDQVQDANGTQLLRLSSLYPLPEFVKKAERTEAADAKTLAGSTFADRRNRMFPCHTKSNSYLSYLYFLDGSHSMPEKQAREIQGNLDRMARVWNLDGPSGAVTLLKQAFEKRAADVYSRLTDNDFAMVQDYGGQLVRRLPVHNPASVKRAAEMLLQSRSKYPYAWRKEAARKILKRAEELQTELESECETYLCKAAGYGFNTAQAISNQLHKRASVLRGFARFRSAANELSKFAEDVRAMDMTPEVIEKVAAFLDGFDRRTGLYNRYEGPDRLDTPEEVVYSITEKKAQEHLDGFITFTSGHSYSKDELEKAGVDLFAAALGDDIEGLLFHPESSRLDIEKASEILPTLPRDDAQNLVDALYTAGIAPVEKQAGLNKAASISYDAAMDLGGWKQWAHDNAAAYGNRGVPKVITRADELAEMHSRDVSSPSRSYVL